MRSGGLFAGYGGLDMAVAEVFGAEPAWFSEIDEAPSKILAHHWPDVPNHGDITQIDWDALEPVDILSGGFPCQDVSAAGKRAGLHPDTRSGLWNHMAYAISKLRPQYVVVENVRGLLSAEAHSDVEPCPWCLGDGPGEPALRALGAVLGDLAELGYDARWCGLRAADVGAPHGRFRFFGLAEDANVSARGERRLAAPGQTEGGWSWPDVGGRGGVLASDSPHDHGNGRSDTGATGRRAWVAPSDPYGNPVRKQPVSLAGSGGSTLSGLIGSHSAAYPQGDGWHQGWTESARKLGRSDAPECGSSLVAWGGYQPAIERWERVLGRPAPAPTEVSAKGSQRLSPRFVEWMMGLPPGHVTDVPGVNRNAQLKALGNGVVPQQAIAALRYLTSLEVAA